MVPTSDSPEAVPFCIAPFARSMPHEERALTDVDISDSCSSVKSSDTYFLYHKFVQSMLEYQTHCIF